MNITKLTTIFLLSLITNTVTSQSFDWVRPAPIAYSINPAYPESQVYFDAVSNRVIHSRIDTEALIYGSSALGTSFVENRDTNGLLILQFQQGNYASVQWMMTDLSANIYVGGLFKQT